jgi:hypothetical protein
LRETKRKTFKKQKVNTFCFDDGLAILKPCWCIAGEVLKIIIMKNIKSLVLFVSGFTTLFLTLIIPIGGGGISLIFIITVPVLIILGIVFSLLHHFWISKFKSLALQKSFFILLLLILISLSFLFYPYS